MRRTIRIVVTTGLGLGLLLGTTGVASAQGTGNDTLALPCAVPLDMPLDLPVLDVAEAAC